MEMCFNLPIPLPMIPKDKVIVGVSDLSQFA